jgi:hypothetical protein
MIEGARAGRLLASSGGGRVGFVSITLDGRRLRVLSPVTGEAMVRADVEPPAEDAVFERVDLAHGRVALRLPDGRYVARHATHPGLVEQPGSSSDRARASALHLVDELTPCAAFEEHAYPDGTVSLRGCDLRFLGVLPDGTVVAGRVADGSWERFRYREVAAPSEALPPHVESPPETTYAAL